MKLLKFLGASVALYVIAHYVPYGIYGCAFVYCIALWKLVND